MLTQPVFSVVTVVRNNVDGLKRTYQSLESQERVDFEWIVVDGKSGDGTTEFLHQVEGVCRWVSESDDGVYDAMNRGASLCRGEYVVFMNGGDRFSGREVLASVWELAQNESSPDVIYGGARLMLRGGASIYRGPRKVERYIAHGLPANHQATYYRREVLPPVPYDLKYRIAGDYYLAARLFREGARAAYINKVLVEFEGSGVSYKSPGVLVSECLRIQKLVLDVPRGQRVISAVRRAVNIGVTLLLSRT